MSEGNQYLEKGKSDEYRDNFDSIFRKPEKKTEEDKPKMIGTGLIENNKKL